MELVFVAPELRALDASRAELLVVGVWEDVRPFTGTSGLVDYRLHGALSRLAEEGFLTGKLGETLLVAGRPRTPFDKVLVLGAGRRRDFDKTRFDAVLGALLRALDDLRAKRVFIELPGRHDGALPIDMAAEVVLHIAAIDPEISITWVEHAAGQEGILTRRDDERRRARRT